MVFQKAHHGVEGVEVEAEAGAEVEVWNKVDIFGSIVRCSSILRS